MSRKITEQTRAHFEAARPMRSGNTAVTLENGNVVIRLHGNAIACRNTGTGETRFTLAGWDTPTTRERLHAARVYIGQCKGEQVMHAAAGARLIDSQAWYDAATGDEVARPQIA